MNAQNTRQVQPVFDWGFFQRAQKSRVARAEPNHYRTQLTGVQRCETSTSSPHTQLKAARPSSQYVQ